MRVARELVPFAPTIEAVAAALELRQRFGWVAGLDVQRIARLAECEAARQPARRGERGLDIEAVIDHRHVSLQVDLRLAVGAHAAERGPEALVPEGERCNQRM